MKDWCKRPVPHFWCGLCGAELDRMTALSPDENGGRRNHNKKKLDVRNNVRYNKAMTY